MPFYNCACSRDLGDDKQARIAEVIGAIHCGLTGAPLHFVNVLFLKKYRLRKGEVISIIGNVRTGGNRTPELIERLRRDLQASIAVAASLAPTEVVVKLVSIEAKWVMEGGRIVPEPGEEEELEKVSMAGCIDRLLASPLMSYRRARLANDGAYTSTASPAIWSRPRPRS
jgi:hypothetical protein